MVFLLIPTDPVFVSGGTLKLLEFIVEKRSSP